MCACIFPGRQLTFIKACSSEMLACLVIHAHTHSCSTCIARETSHSRLPQGVCVGVCVWMCVYVCKVMHLLTTPPHFPFPKNRICAC